MKVIIVYVLKKVERLVGAVIYYRTKPTGWSHGHSARGVVFTTPRRYYKIVVK